jgi:iron complex outermembrane recepter protein
MRLFYTFLCFLFVSNLAIGQYNIRGKIQDADTGEELIGTTVAVEGTKNGAVTDFEGNFTVKVDALPAKLRISYTGYIETTIDVTTASERLSVKLKPNTTLLSEALVVGQRIDDKQKAAPLTVENLDAIAIKQAASLNFYNALGNLKGVDLTTASLGFTIINTRGFNSTAPVRSLQTIDGVDNQAPGLNFSLGNFLGASDLDVLKVDLIAGASSSYYGPNAFNGVIAMTSKDPFTHQGLSASVKVGERNLLEGAIRYAQAFKNKNKQEVFAYKLNLFGLSANDWRADNYDPISSSKGNQVFANPTSNPAGWDAVNTYGDEGYTGNSFASLYDSRAGLNTFYRTGYKESELVDYTTKNGKASAAFHFRLKPEQSFESPELILASSYGTGTTVYQGDNRFRLKGIQFYQNRIELRKRDKFYVRFYSTNEDAGKSFDPYFTALKMQEASKTDEIWSNDYQEWWVKNDLGNVFNKMRAQGYPAEPIAAQYAWQQANYDSLAFWHQQAAAYANRGFANEQTLDFFAPGTARYDSLFQSITTRRNNRREGGTQFYDKSALYHAAGEYKFTPSFLKEWIVGASGRLYRPVSDGTIFGDTLEPIKTHEFGVYTGVAKQMGDFTANATLRMDKNKNFDALFTPALSLVYNPSQNNFLRASFSSAIRNPTLSDQYLNLNVGPATLVGNLTGFDSLITLDNFSAWREDMSNKLEPLTIGAIRPEKVKTFELGYRTSIGNVYIDAGYYFNFYKDFIGYNIGLRVPFNRIEIFPGNFLDLLDPNGIKAYRVASNAKETVTTQGFSIGLNYYFAKYYMVQGNYSWNKLNTAEKDPIVPAFNTPEHKFNIGISARDIKVGNNQKTLGFNATYKWIQGFVFEGSPQFTGNIPGYQLLDVQTNVTIPKLHSVIKVGASNVLNNLRFQTYGGPRIGRMGYISLVYDFNKGKS